MKARLLRRLREFSADWAGAPRATTVLHAIVPVRRTQPLGAGLERETRGRKRAHGTGRETRFCLAKIAGAYRGVIETRRDLPPPLWGRAGEGGSRRRRLFRSHTS